MWLQADLSVNGSEGAGCTGRSPEWSLKRSFSQAIQWLGDWGLGLQSNFSFTSCSLSLCDTHTVGGHTIWWNRQGGKQRDWEGGTLNKCVMVQYLPALSMSGCILSRDFNLAAESVDAPSSVPSPRLYRSLPLSLHRDSAHTQVLFIPRSKK